MAKRSTGSTTKAGKSPGRRAPARTKPVRKVKRPAARAKTARSPKRPLAPVDQYLENVDDAMAPTARELVSLVRKALPGAVERVQWGIAIFAVNGRDVAGVAVRHGMYNVYAPHGHVTLKYLPELGRVDAGKGRIRFRASNDLNRVALKKMLLELRDHVLAATNSPTA